MDYLPKDPAILVSSVNMLLRDEEFDTLESLCYNFGTEPKDIKNYLYGHGFVYSEKQKQFRPIGYRLSNKMITKDSIATTSGFRRISPRLWRYLKKCYNNHDADLHLP